MDESVNDILQPATGARNEPTVLITGVGGSSSVEVIKSLKANGYRVIGVDATEYAAGYAIVDAPYVVPFADEARFEAVFAELLAKERPDFVIPLVDEEILPVHRIVAALDPRVRVVSPSESFCRLAMDKWHASQALVDAGIPAPRTWLASASAGCTFPAVIKPRTGRGSRGLAYLENKGELDRYLEAAVESADKYIVQEQILGTEYTVSVVVALGGPLLAVVPKEVVIKKGITQVGVTRVVPEIHRVCSEIQEKLGANGPFNVQLMLSHEGIPYTFEINPRYSTTTVLTLAAGIDELDIVLRHARGLTYGSPEFIPNLMMLRHYTALYLPEHEFSQLNRQL